MVSDQFNDALYMTAIIEELCRMDNWKNMDEVLAIKPSEMKKYQKMAEACLRAIKNVNNLSSPVVAQKN